MKAFQRVARIGGVLALSLMLLGTLSGCLVVGFSNGRGWFVWPRGFGFVLILILLVFLLRRRRY
jgi:hypothetical protein